MRGTDLTEDDLGQARQFLEHISSVEWPEDTQAISITRAEMIRIVAWYGAIRANGDRSGKLVSNGKPLRRKLDLRQSPEPDGGAR